MTDDQYPIIRADDLAATLTAFAIEFAAAMNSPENKTPNEKLRALAGQLETMAGKMADTPAAAAVELTSMMLRASDPEADT
ncbi:MAG: hypothetical protein ABS54_06405 [Hyphomicrobium sp. SCN 65-11]|nr:MAG: hypothetical protein ABS54_06405 [Hyphomicrobium sp. SCN 65-11]